MSIWYFFTGPIDWLSIFCNILVFVIPYSIYKLNQWLHKYGDPVWKKEKKKESEG